MKVKFQHRLLVVAIALLTIFSIATSASAAEDANSLRIYGEEGLSAAFPYTDPEAPFDPMNIESPEKDFVTFNPALIEDDIVVNNIDSKQKVFTRQWFVPEYTEPTGMVWLDDFIRCFDRTLDTGEVIEEEEVLTEDDLRAISLDQFEKPIKRVEWVPNHNEYTWEDVVTDYTYMFVDKHYQPRAATAKSTTGAYWTTFWFPVADNDDAQIGLDGYDIDYDGVDDMVVLKKVGDFNYDGYKDIDISSDLISVKVGDKVQFLDHIVEIDDIYYDGSGELAKVGVKVYYNGNKEPELIGTLHEIDVEKGILSAGRHTVTDDKPQFYEPWYLKVEATSVGSDKVLLTVGRQLYERETFFVDGAEYDVARIYGPEYNSVKYITIRNPVPEHQDVSINDLSVVKEMVDNGEYLPLLPPLNKVHTMVDDINIPHNEYEICPYTGYEGSILNEAAPDGEWYEDIGISDAYDTVEERKIYDVDPLLIYFINKDLEPRFHTNLLELLDEGELKSVDVEVVEAWKWLHIRTMPDFYKEFVYPELPDIDEGTGDFLFTSSFRAENSILCDDVPQYVCNFKNIVWPQRLMFVYDQVTGAEDIYVNEIDTETNGLRVYGEDGLTAAFPYEDPEAPFDPLSDEAPEKDFVTLNPAKIKAGIVVDNKDSHEKVFFRQWFVPEYTEPTGMVWLDDFYRVDGDSRELLTEEDLRKPPQDCIVEWVPNHNEYVWEDVVNEFTYMFIDKHYQPTAATAMSSTGAYWTTFWFPVADNDEQIGLDSFDINYDGVDDMVLLKKVGDFNHDTYKDIKISSDLLSVGVGERVQFLDHIVEIDDINYDGNGEISMVSVKVYYNGNKEPVQIGTLHTIDVEYGILSAGRHTVTDNYPQFYEPWYLEIEGTGVNHDKVLLTVGRQLYERETFFVDGAEYDVARIFGPEYNDVKYITIRNPLPEHKDIALNDLSVVKKAVYDGDIIPVLPPFNGDHIMIDDIDVPHYIPGGEDTTCYYGQWFDSTATDDLLWYHDMYINTPYDTIAERMFDVPATEIYFTGKDYEDRFHTNLLELLRECDGVVATADTIPVKSFETWKWLHIYTMPDFYKEFVYPDVPNAGGEGDYLLTSSFTAPNSDVCDNVELSTEFQRIMFTYDPTDGTGLYMNGGAPVVEPPVDEMKGDYDGNEIVNFDDFVEFAACYNSVMGDSNYNAIFDFDDDGDVDFDDFVEFAGVYQS
ncbi:hypothetical protein RE476_02290 [Methanolobus mangrovi]|uniref:EF-hand domain-containing protein n=1 Tax=Methanolobus mangrovi TaxID=3072977 RepID=A0AA51YJJ7_9EURY|nr:hypothetical protein [Methanolobus mangrovi]WMW22668.1 hypothetical protein RE476_02290 [Methanolobus mangrovi]